MSDVTFSGISSDIPTEGLLLHRASREERIRSVGHLSHFWGEGAREAANRPQTGMQHPAANQRATTHEANQRAAEHPAAEHSATEHPPAEHPAAKQPAAEHPAAEHRVTNHSAAEHNYVKNELFTDLGTRLRIKTISKQQMASSGIEPATFSLSSARWATVPYRRSRPNWHLAAWPDYFSNGPFGAQTELVCGSIQKQILRRLT